MFWNAGYSPRPYHTGEYGRNQRRFNGYENGRANYQNNLQGYTEYTPRPWQGGPVYAQGRGNRYELNQNSTSQRIEDNTQRPLQITTGEVAPGRRTPHLNQATGPQRNNAQPPRPWQARQQPYLTSNNPGVRAYHSEVTDEIMQRDDRVHDEHQDYAAYEDEFNENNTYCANNEPQGETEWSSDTEEREHVPSSAQQNEMTEALFSTPTKPTVECRNCHGVYDSKNKLHKHLRSG